MSRPAEGAISSVSHSSKKPVSASAISRDFGELAFSSISSRLATSAAAGIDNPPISALILGSIRGSSFILCVLIVWSC